MALGVRSANPIWSFVNLAGLQCDDTYYMWVLQNEIPYAPATIYQDPDLNTPWTDPIQFLGNGTLPDNMYWESGVVYRLEIRQHLGLGSPTQYDPLVYLIENFTPPEGGTTPVNTVAFSSTNQITNPQFAFINFQSPFSLSATNPAALNIGPGWFLELAGTGNVTVTQVPLNDSNVNPSNAPYALRLTLSGWTSGSVFLRQRFYQNGMLWANKYVSSTLTAQINGAPQGVSASLVDSNSSFLGTVLTVPAIDEEWNEFTGYALLPASTNPDTPPAAYIDYLLALPSNIDIYISSIQLVVQDLPVEPTFEQDSINRQLDHTYHDAYPIVPIGSILAVGGFSTPRHYLPCAGGAYSRLTYSQLFNTLTTTETVTLASSTVFTVANGAIYRVGMGVEGTGIPAQTTITTISGNSVTISSAATMSGSSTLRFYSTAPQFTFSVSLTNTMNTFTVSSAANLAVGMAVTGIGIPSATVITIISGTTITISNAATATQTSLVTFYGVGNGDGSTTFNVFNLQDKVIAGAGGTGILSAGTGNGSATGYPTHLMTLAELVAHTHGIYGTNVSGTASGASGTGLATPQNLSGTSGSAGSSTPFTIVQPTTFMNYYIRYE